MIRQKIYYALKRYLQKHLDVPNTLYLGADELQDFNFEIPFVEYDSFSPLVWKGMEVIEVNRDNFLSVSNRHKGLMVRGLNNV